MNDDLTLNHSQLEMPLSKAAADQDYVPDSVVAKQPSSKAALTLSISTAGLEDQDIYVPLNIKPSVWSRIRSGSFNFPNDKLSRFVNIVNNDLYLRWLNYQCGYKCEPILSTLEQENEALKAEKAELERDNKLMRELLKK